MAVARLAEPPDQDVVAGLEEHDARHDPAALQGTTHRRERERRVPGPHVDDDRHAGEPAQVRRHQLRQIRQELTGQVVDHGVPEVLEQLRRGGLAAARQARQDHDRLILGTVRDGVFRGLAHRPVRLMNRTVSLVQQVHRPTEHERAHEVATGRGDGREDGDRENHIASDLAEAIGGDDAHARQAHEKDRELHDQPEGQEGGRHEVEEGSRGDVLDEPLVIEAEQERQGVRQDQIRDPDAHGEEEQGQRDPGSDGLALRLGEARGDERPDLIEDHRHRQDDPDDERDPQLDGEAVARSEGLRSAVGHEVQEGVSDRRGQHEADDPTDHDREDHPEEARP